MTHPPSTAQAWPYPRRWWLAGLLLLALLTGLLGVLVFLAREYEVAREQDELSRDVEAIANDMRSELTRNTQTVQLLNSADPNSALWQQRAERLLQSHRALVRLEWRDPDMALLASSNTPFLGALFQTLPRDQALPDIRRACDAASRISGPSYSSNYFWPTAGGRGLALMEMCLPIAQSGTPKGFLVATYSLAGMMAEWANTSLLRGRGLAFTEADGTRLSLHATVPGGRELMLAGALLDLPGHTLQLQLQSPRRPLGLFPNVLTAVVGALSLSLLVVLAFLAHDMRRRWRAERELAEALAFRKAMENSLVTGLRARDMQGRLTYVNPAFCDMVGLPPEQLLGSGLPAPYWPDELLDVYQQRQAVRQAGQALPREGFESMFQRSDGTRFPVLIIEAPLIDAHGTQTGWMSAVLDLSEQRRVEELNRAQQDRLQATARLAMMGEMASLLSHELNQPLAAIASYANGSLNLLADPQRGDDGLPSAMRQIVAQADRAARVIKSVSDFVRRREQVREAVNAADLLESIQPLLALQASKLGIRVLINVQAGVPPVVCDRTMVEQVLLNLARNGMQAMPHGDPPARSGWRVLTLSVQAVTPEASAARRWVEFAVTDHGQGLSEAAQTQLFTPFFTTKADGMGLGLSLCRTVIEQHAGELTHAPVLPRGTVFRFRLPAAPAL
ncbi:MAG: Sensor protein FixL [Pseudomonadota bacterium]|jgi:two-component system sensor histidine kinase DctS